MWVAPEQVYCITTERPLLYAFHTVIFGEAEQSDTPIF